MSLDDEIARARADATEQARRASQREHWEEGQERRKRELVREFLEKMRDAGNPGLREMRLIGWRTTRYGFFWRKSGTESFHTPHAVWAIGDKFLDPEGGWFRADVRDPQGRAIVIGYEKSPPMASWTDADALARDLATALVHTHRAVVSDDNRPRGDARAGLENPL